MGLEVWRVRTNKQSGGRRGGGGGRGQHVSIKSRSLGEKGDGHRNGPLSRDTPLPYFSYIFVLLNCIYMYIVLPLSQFYMIRGGGGVEIHQNRGNNGFIDFQSS